MYKNFHRIKKEVKYGLSMVAAMLVAEFVLLGMGDILFAHSKLRYAPFAVVVLLAIAMYNQARRKAIGGAGSTGNFDSTFTVPEGVTKLRVVCVGAGGSGGASDELGTPNIGAGGDPNHVLQFKKRKYRKRTKKAKKFKKSKSLSKRK